MHKGPLSNFGSYKKDDQILGKLNGLKFLGLQQSVNFHFARDIGEKCGKKQNHPIKIDSLFTDFFLISPTSCLD